MTSTEKLFISNAIRIVGITATMSAAITLGSSNRSSLKIMGPPVALIGGFATGGLVKGFKKYADRKNDPSPS